MGLKELERTLCATSPSGARHALLLLGNGMHLQAAREVGLKNLDPWLAVTCRLAGQLGIRDVRGLPSQEPARWDALVRHASAALNLSSSKADEKLKTWLVQKLIKVERQRSSLPLFGRLLDLHFENILSFNIDRTLALHSDCKRVVPEHWERWEPNLHVYDDISARNGIVTRIWYPYGDTCNRLAIVAGTEQHAHRLMDLEDERSLMMHEWLDSARWFGSGARLAAPRQFYER